MSVICQTCGALVEDINKHSDYHNNIVLAIETLRMQIKEIYNKEEP